MIIFKKLIFIFIFIYNINTIFMTPEEAKVDSIIATQNALIELGKYTAKLELEKELKEKKIKELKSYLLKGKEVFPIGIEHIKKDRSRNYYVNFDELGKYLDAVNEYIKLVDDTNLEYESKIKKLENYIENTDIQLKTITLENSNLEDKLEKRQKYWINRVHNLRNKCIDKNKNYDKLLIKKNRILNILYFIFLYLSSNIIIINLYGLEKSIQYSIYYTTNTINFIYFTLIYSYKFLYWTYEIVFNYRLLMLSLLFGFIGQKYLFYKRNFGFIRFITFITFIGFIGFIYVGNSLYKTTIITKST